MLAGIDKMTAGYAWIVRKLVRISVLSIVLLVGVFALTGGIFSVTPQGFLPEEDQGAMFAVLQIPERSEEHTSELQSLMRISYAVFCLKKKKQPKHTCYYKQNHKPIK